MGRKRFREEQNDDSFSQKNLSCFQRKKIQMKFSLHPTDLHDINGEIRQSLMFRILRYMPVLDGVLLAFDNIKPTTSVPGNSTITSGMVLNEQPQIHYSVQLNVLVFSPQLQEVMSGKVTQCYESHIGLLVHNFFNASITSDYLHEAGFYFVDGKGDGVITWVHKDDKNIVIAPEVNMNFILEKVHECAGIISMEGSQPSLRIGDVKVKNDVSTSQWENLGYNGF
mmetsp:Transcript_7679/g.8762  ORF Transcript_7679/g.8762 Transcript_7679/m.8762 type:complete len:225 (+) Transcript_7679:62-736(+)